MMFPYHSSNMSGNSSGSANSRSRRDRITGTICLSLSLTLEEMYCGTTCKFLCRKTKRIRKVVIYPGTRPSQEVKYAPKPGYCGNAYMLTLLALNHPTFELQGDNLVMVMPLELVESLCGFTKMITTLDNRKLAVSVPKGKVTTNLSEMCIKGEGMPMYKHNHLRGDLIIRFEVGLPAKIASGCVARLEQCLPPRPVIDIPLEAEERNLIDIGMPPAGELDYELMEDDYTQFYQQLNNGFKGNDQVLFQQESTEEYEDAAMEQYYFE